MHVEDFAADGTSVDAQYFDAYDDMAVHRLMLEDRPRMAFYHQMLSSQDRVAGRVVVDVGAGTGILSLWALLHGGAARCISFEASGLASVCQQLAADNGVADNRLTIVARKVEDVVAEGVDAFLCAHGWLMDDSYGGGVDIVVSEWMGFYLLHECMLPSVIAARDFFTAVNVAIVHRRGGASSAKVPKMLPERAAIVAAPVNLDALREDRFAAPFNAAVTAAAGTFPMIDFSRLGRLEYEAKLAGAGSMLVEVVPAACLLAEPVEILNLDLNQATVDDALRLPSLAANFRFSGPRYNGTAALHGFALWFHVSCSLHAHRDAAPLQQGGLVAALPPANMETVITLSTSPLDPPTHWKQSVVLLDADIGWRGNEIVVPPGTCMKAMFSIVCNDPTTRQYTVSVELEDGDDDDNDAAHM